jgi:uncharacterized protein (DUF1778 family)
MPKMANVASQHASRRTAKKPSDTRKPLNIRILPETRSLIDHAAELTGKNLTDFVLDAARQAAQRAILDRTVIPMSRKSYAAFVALLEAPRSPTPTSARACKLPRPGKNRWRSPHRLYCPTFTISTNLTAARFP